MKNNTDEIIEQLARRTHSPRGKYAPSDATYQELLERLPATDRPVLGSHAEGGRKIRWNAAAGLLLLVGIGAAFAGIYTFRHELFGSDVEDQPTDIPVSSVSPRLLVFDNLPLADIAEQLSEAYGVEIIIASPELAVYRMTATFSTDEALDDVLDALSEVGGFDVERTSSAYSLHQSPN